MASYESVAGEARALTADLKDVVREMSQQLGETEFLRVSLLLCKIVQNAVVLGPEQALYRSVLLRSSTMCVPGAVDFMLLSGFERDDQGTYLVLPDPIPLKLLEAGKQVLQTARRRYDAVEGLEVPVRSLKVAERIGKGKFGEVYNGFWDKRAVALKTLKPKCDEHAVAEFHKEAKIMRLLNHSNIVSLLAVTLTMEPAYLVLELMRGCFLDSLHDGAASTAGEQLESAFQVAAGMDYLHQRGVLHCDLAARNILINSDGVLKISDFGHARMVGSAECNVAGKAGKFPTRWVAPEILFEGLISKASDVWSFGITFYEFVTAGSMPYGSLTNAETKQRVATGYRLSQPVDCPDEFHALMVKCWSKLPGARPAFPAIVSDLAKDRQKFVSGTLHFRRTVANEDGRARSSSPGSGGSISSVDSSNNWTDSPLGSHGHTPPSLSPSPQLRQHKEKQNRGGKLKKFGFGRSSTDNLMKGESVVQVFTMLVSPLQPSVAIPLKAKHRCSELVSLALKQLGKPPADSSQYALVELKSSDGTSSGAGDVKMTFLSRFIIDSERPLSIKATWPSVQTCHFVLCSAHGNDSAILSAINEHFSSDDNASALHQRCRGYLLKFQESRGGTKVAGRSKSENWQRFWGVVDGNALLLYRDEVEENNGEPITYIQLQNCTTEHAVDVSKKRDVLRLFTALGDAVLLRTCGKDVYRWMEAVFTASSASASTTLEKFGDGELLYTGHLLIDETPLTGTFMATSKSGLGSSAGSSRNSVASFSSAAELQRGRRSQRSATGSESSSVGLPSIASLPTHRRLLCVLKGRQLLAFVGEARRELLDFADVVAISVLNPTSMLNWSASRDSSATAATSSSVEYDEANDDDDCLMTFGIQVDVRSHQQSRVFRGAVPDRSADAAVAAASATHRFFLKPDTPGELDSWTDAFDKLLLKLGKGDLMVPLSSEKEQDSDRAVDVVDGPTDAPAAPPMAAVGSELPEIQEVPASPIAEAFARATSLDEGGGGLVAGGVVRRSIRRRQETGFVAVAKLRKASLYLDERSVYDNDSCVDGDDITTASSLQQQQQHTQRKVSGGAVNPKASFAEDSVLSPVSEGKGTSTAGTPTNPELAKGLASPSKTEQLRALIAMADKTLDKDDVLSPTLSSGSRRSATDLASATPPQSRSPAKPSPRHRTLPSGPPTAAGIDNASSTVISAAEGQTPSQPIAVMEEEQRRNPSSADGKKASCLPPAVASKPVPSPRTLRRNREAGKTAGNSNTTTAAATSSTVTLASSQDPAAYRGTDQPSPPVRGKRPPPPISPRPSRHHLVNPPPVAAAASAELATEPAIPKWKAPVVAGIPADASAAAGGGTKAEETNAALGMNSPDSALPPDSKPAARKRSEPAPPLPHDAGSTDDNVTLPPSSSEAVQELSKPPPPLPHDTASKVDDVTSSLSSSETPAVPAATIAVSPTRINTDSPSHATTSTSPPPLPPDRGTEAGGPREQPQAESTALSAPPAIPLKKSRSKSVHNLVTTMVTAATLPRNLSRSGGGGSVDYSGNDRRPLTSSASVSSENLLSAQQPPLPPKQPGSRRGSSKQSLAASASSEQLSASFSQSGGAFFRPSTNASTSDSNLRQSSLPEGSHVRQVSSPAKLLRSHPAERPTSPSAARFGRHRAATGVGPTTVAGAFSPHQSSLHSSSLASASAAEEYMDMGASPVPLSASSASLQEEYVEMSDQSLARSESLLATTMGSSGGSVLSAEERHRSPLRHMDSAHSVTSSSSGTGADEYVPMSPLDPDSFMRPLGHSLSASGRPALSAQTSLDSSVTVSQEYVDMADDPVSSPPPSRGAPASMRPHAGSVLRPHASSSASALHAGQKGKPHRKPAYAEIPQDEGDEARILPGVPHPYASIPDDDATDEPPPLPSRPPGKPQGQAKSPSLFGRLTSGHNTARRTTQPSVAAAAADHGVQLHRPRTESVPNSAKAALLQGRRSVAIGPASGGGTASRSGSTAAAGPGAVASSLAQAPRQRSATVSVSSSDGGDAAAAESATATLGRKSRKKAKEKEKEKVLAPNWKILKDARGSYYFYENATGRTAWTYEGMTAMYEKSLLPAPPPPRGKSENEPGSGWKAQENQDGRLFYFNKKKKLSTWSIEDTWR